MYAAEAIKKGELIEVCELLLIPSEQAIDALDAYVFTFTRTTLALALGNGSLYNHRNQPNALCYFDHGKQLLYFEAKKDISSAEEIFINYGYSSADKKKFGIV